MADTHGIAFLIVSCEADLPELEARIERRGRLGLDPSDADLEELHQQLRAWVPIGIGDQPRVVTINTMRPEAICEALPRLRTMLHERELGR
jgi:uncharacterized protein